MKFILSLLLAFPLIASAGCLSINGKPMTVNGSVLCLDGNSPMNLPMLTASQASSMFTFLGSFTLPSGGATPVSYGSGTVSVSGNTMYVSSITYAPTGTSTSQLNQYIGIASFTIPTLTGTPDYTGGNGSVSSAQVNGPNGPGTMAPQNYTLTASPAPSATSATLVTLPTGIAANAGWYIKFSDGEAEEITAISGNTVSWATALTGTGLSTTVSIWEWQPKFIWATQVGSANNTITGIQEYNGELYVTGGSSFSGCSGDDLGWIATTSPSVGPTWGAVNTATNAQTGSTTESSRYYASPLALLPSEWQPYFGTMYQPGGPSLSDVGCFGKQGATFQEFNPADVLQTGGSVPITTALGYYYSTSSPNPESLAGRQFSGPFPTCTQTASCSPSPTGYPATLTAAPTSGATSVNLSLPTSVVTVTANFTNGSNTMDVTSIDSGDPISNAGITYNASDSGGAGVITGIGAINPSYYYTPGTSLGVGSNYQLFNAVTGSATGDTVTLTPEGYGAAEASASAWTITFSDGEGRVAQIATTAVGATSTTATFTPALECGTNGYAACTTAVTVAPMGDALLNPYDGNVGGGFIVPNTRTFVSLWLHANGVDTPRGGACGGNSSSSMWEPLAPDTNYYSGINLYLYDLKALYAQAQGQGNVWDATPSVVPFYDNTNLDGQNGCPELLSTAYQIGWSYFDYSDDILYVNVSQNPTIIDEYQLTPP